MEKYSIVQLFIKNNYEIMDWNKLKKATINATSIFGDEDYINLNSDEFPEVTFLKNSPQEVELKLVK